MADEKQKIKQAQTLSQTAKNVGDPSNMAKIIGAAGGGLWDFLQQSYEHMVPQSVEELALEGSPVGKALGTGAKMVAGLPFTAYLPKLTKLKGGVGHGTTSVDKIVEEGIDPEVFDKGDVLGWLFHAAENPEYFNKYADGTLKGVRGERSGVLPLAPRAQNVLDLVEPNTQDLATAVGQLEPLERMHTLDRFKKAKGIQRDLLSQADAPMDARKYLQKARMARIATGVKPSHFPVADPWTSGQQTFKITDDPLIHNLPAAAVADRLRLSPEQFSATPFDAIRYHDMDEVSWAFDTNRVPMTTTMGTEIPVQRPLWKQGAARPNWLTPSFSVDEAGQTTSRYGRLSPDDAADVRRSQLEQVVSGKRFNKNKQQLMDAGFSPEVAIRASEMSPEPRWLNAEVAVQNFSLAQQQELLKAWQYLHPTASIGKVTNSSYLGDVVQALVPTNNNMSRIVLGK